MSVPLQRDHDKSKSIREQEEKMMVSAWYNLVRFLIRVPPLVKFMLSWEMSTALHVIAIDNTSEPY